MQIGDGSTGPGALGGNLVNNSSAASPLIFNTPAAMSVTFSGNLSGTGTGAVEDRAGDRRSGRRQHPPRRPGGQRRRVDSQRGAGLWRATIISAGTLNVLNAARLLAGDQRTGVPLGRLKLRHPYRQRRLRHGVERRERKRHELHPVYPGPADLPGWRDQRPGRREFRRLHQPRIHGDVDRSDRVHRQSTEFLRPPRRHVGECKPQRRHGHPRRPHRQSVENEHGRRRLREHERRDLHQRRSREPRPFYSRRTQLLEAVSSSPQSNWASALGEYSSATGRCYNGYIGKVVVYSGTLTASQQTAVSEYLEAKWLGVGVPGGNALPSTSPVSLTAVGATLNIGYDQSIASLSGVAGSVVNQEAGTLTVGGDNSSTTFAGSLNVLAPLAV